MRIVPLWLLLSCGRWPVVDAEPSVPRPVVGDANGDGRVDVSDGLFLLRWRMGGGPAPPCAAAADFLPDGRADADDGLVIWGWLFQGAQGLPEGTPCASAPALTAPSGRMGVALEVPDAAPGEVAVGVSIGSRTLPIEAWSFSVAAEGCTVIAASTAGTPAAGTEAGGLRGAGYDHTRIVPGGAVSVVVLDAVERVALPVGRRPHRVLDLRLQRTGEGCGRCRLTLGDGLVGLGQPVDLVLTSGGRTYRPEPVIAELEMCP